MRRIVTERCRGPRPQESAPTPGPTLFDVDPHDPVAKTLPGQYHGALFRSLHGFKEDLD